MDTLYHAIARLLWHIYLKIEARRKLITPDLYLDRSVQLCTIDDTGNVITFGAHHD